MGSKFGSAQFKRNEWGSESDSTLRKYKKMRVSLTAHNINTTNGEYVCGLK